MLELCEQIVGASDSLISGSSSSPSRVKKLVLQIFLRLDLNVMMGQRDLLSHMSVV